MSNSYLDMGGSGEYNSAVMGFGGSVLGTPLEQLLMQDSIQPGSDPSYELCKLIYLYHPLGAKMVELPLTIAQSQQREISIPKSPEDRVKEAFTQEWTNLKANEHIFNVMRTSRTYGIGAIVYGAKGVPSTRPIANRDLYKLEIYFNVVDPLNTAGSLVLNQSPNSPDFQKYTNIAVSGEPYHRSRSCVMLNEEPVYIAYTVSSFGFVGRSVYQRALFPLKSYVQTMITDDLVTRKAGVLVAKMKQQGSVADKVMQGLVGLKRKFIQLSQTGSVLTVGENDSIETLNMQNTDTAMTVSRKNIIENIAAAASMPALLLNNETFAEGFGEGTEDAKAVASYIEGIRNQMKPLYDFFDMIVQYRAWNPDFYKTIQAEFPEQYGNVPYTQAFYQWQNSFTAKWPSLLIEPESEQVEVEKVKLWALVSAAELLLPELDPINKAHLLQWIVDNFNEQKMLYKSELTIDLQSYIDYSQQMLAQQQGGSQQGSISSLGGNIGDEGDPGGGNHQNIRGVESGYTELGLSPKIGAGYKGARIDSNPIREITEKLKANASKIMEVVK